MSEAEKNYNNLMNTIESKKQALSTWEEISDKPKSPDV